MWHFCLLWLICPYFFTFSNKSLHWKSEDPTLQLTAARRLYGMYMTFFFLKKWCNKMQLHILAICHAYCLFALHAGMFRIRNWLYVCSRNCQTCPGYRSTHLCNHKECHSCDGFVLGSLHTPTKNNPNRPPPQKVYSFLEVQKEHAPSQIITNKQKHFQEQHKVGIALYLIFFPKYVYLLPGLDFIH